MSLISKQSNNVSLTTNLQQLKKLIAEDAKSFEKNVPLPYQDIKHAVEISNILLWLARNHPEVLNDEAQELQNISIKRLDFCKSWESPEELFPTDALTILLKSRICNDLQSFCGFLNLQILKSLPDKICKLRVSLNKHSDIIPLIEELKRRRQRHPDTLAATNDFEGEITVHLRCGELDLAELMSLPDNNHRLYISGVTDIDVDWVVQAAIALVPKDYIKEIYFPRSKLTRTGVEAIAKGLCHAGSLVELGVSSPSLNDDCDSSSDDSDDSSSGNSSDDSSPDFLKYEFESVYFTDEKSLEFTDSTECIEDDIIQNFV